MRSENSLLRYWFDGGSIPSGGPIVDDKFFSTFPGLSFDKCMISTRIKLNALSHGAIFLATCNAILLLGDVKLANACFHHSLPICF